MASFVGDQTSLPARGFLQELEGTQCLNQYHQALFCDGLVVALCEDSICTQD